MCAITCTWTLTLVFQECCHTRQKWKLWVCGFVSTCCVCISNHVPICVSFHTHICTDGILLHLWRLPLFLFSKFSLIFSLCGGHAHFTVVTHTRTFAVTQRLKVICRHFHIHTVAGRHVLCRICARIVVCPLLVAVTFAWEGTCVQFHRLADTFSLSGCDCESKFTLIPYMLHDLSFMSAER